MLGLNLRGSVLSGGNLVWYAIISCELELELGGKVQNGENLAGYGASKTISFVQGLKLGSGFEIIFWYDASKTIVMFWGRI